ncbi:MAG TPA: O-antigen ligase family protein [Candidatus Binataceae bacterium]|nr:O-antigen ligase family protein [Candidatus Binataceae bacterium]
MADFTLTPSIRAPSVSRVPMISIGVVAALAMVWILDGGSLIPFLVILGAAGLVGLIWAAGFTRSRPEWLIVALLLTPELIAINAFEGPMRQVLHFGLIFLFCIPMVPTMVRSGLLKQGGFRLYLIFFAWSGLTVIWSLAPAYSIGRLAESVVLFAALGSIALKVNQPRDFDKVLGHYLIACAVVVAMMGASAVLLPRSITWAVPVLAADGVERFKSVFSGPNEVGGVMLFTVGPAILYWNKVSRFKKILLAVMMAIAVGCTALADSRSPFVGLGAGCLGYVLWRYRLRGVLVLGVLGVLGIGVALLFGKNLVADYVQRGDVTTLTGRTELWQFVIASIKANPIMGYGYQTAGAIFGSKYFPIWWGPWDLGPQSSIHNEYLNHMVGVGVPATILWVFIIVRPWVSIFREKEDPWHLKAATFLIAIPLLIDSLTEAAIGDFAGLPGVTFGLFWVIAERYRIMMIARREAERVENEALVPSGIMAVRPLRVGNRVS